MARTSQPSDTRKVRLARGAAACCPSGPRKVSRPTAEYAPLFKALADETRLEMVGLLAAHGREMCVCDIEAHFAVSQPTVSHHLRVLREAGIVSSERRGSWVYYVLKPVVGITLQRCAKLLQA
ncbi:MAG: winged helix-turn-helix transcriptional regulator [Planctomycetes bacterium]|nr:winged helix-turn-helix transcriptional regulator [Planctomycetota bacterium]MCC7172732.1 winged helix-turn-helix transcriptional regulator [Planctomycetota bacterium]